MAIPLLDGCEIAGQVVTADALLTQRTLAAYLVGRQAHYSFTVKGNQPTLERDIGVLFESRGAPDFVDVAPADHGRIETRRIWCSTALNDYLDFPHVGQVFLIERESIEKKTGVASRESVCGITSQTPQTASPQRVLAINRGHWTALHHRLELRRGSQPNPCRTWPGKHHALTSLCHRHTQVLSASIHVYCRDDAQALFPLPYRLRLLAHDS